jgi:SAM-dependent methyltransferase
MRSPAYDEIGLEYARYQRADARIAAAIEAGLGDARSVLNVGAGTGSYEPVERETIAIEPSREMIAQRPPGSAPVIQARAEVLPFEDDSFDAAMAIFSDHHWRDRAAGLREMLRVARRRVLILNADPALAGRFWLNQDYLPGFVRLIPTRYLSAGCWGKELEAQLGGIELRSVPVPWDCQDGFYYAYWRRPRAYVDDRIRGGISVFHRLPAEEVEIAMGRLRRDLDDGTWHTRHGDLLGLSELDLGLRLAIAELD